MDESLLSIASTLVDSCSFSLNESFDDENEQAGKSNGKNGVMKPFLCRGRITDIQSTNEKLSSPTTTAISLEITESATDRSDRTTVSKLELVRAKTRLLRKQGSQKIKESRASLCKSRTTSIEESQPAANPPPYPPPSVHNKARSARIKQKHSKPTGDLKRDPNAGFSDFLRRSNSVIDRLSAEIAISGNIINQSVDCDATFNDTVANKTNNFTSDLCSQNYYTKNGQDEKSIRDDEDSIHNVSVGEDWDQTTISASLPRTPSSSARLQRSIRMPPSRSRSQSGLPPPEVVVKRITPRGPTRAAPQETEISFSGSPSTTFPPRSTVDRHLRKRPPSISSLRGDCASMYNANQRCEKLAMENDCLKRQLELLESRHRDSQMKLVEQFQRKGDEKTQGEKEEPGIVTPSSCKTSKINAYSFSRKKKKKWSDRRRVAVLLLFAPFLIASTIWLYQSVRSGSSNQSGAQNGIHLTTMMRKGVLSQSLFSETKDTLISDNSNSDTDNEEDIITDNSDEHPLVLHEPPILEFESAKNNEQNNSRKKASRFIQILSRMKFSHQNDPMGVWFEAHRRISTEKHHAEL